MKEMMKQLEEDRDNELDLSEASDSVLLLEDMIGLDENDGIISCQSVSKNKNNISVADGRSCDRREYPFPVLCSAKESTITDAPSPHPKGGTNKLRTSWFRHSKRSRQQQRQMVHVLQGHRISLAIHTGEELSMEPATTIDDSRPDISLLAETTASAPSSSTEDDEENNDKKLSSADVVNTKNARRYGLVSSLSRKGILIDTDGEDRDENSISKRPLQRLRRPSYRKSTRLQRYQYSADEDEKGPNGRGVHDDAINIKNKRNVEVGRPKYRYHRKNRRYQINSNKLLVPFWKESASGSDALASGEDNGRRRVASYRPLPRKNNQDTLKLSQACTSRAARNLRFAKASMGKTRIVNSSLVSGGSDEPSPDTEGGAALIGTSYLDRYDCTTGNDKMRLQDLMAITNKGNTGVPPATVDDRVSILNHLGGKVANDDVSRSNKSIGESGTATSAGCSPKVVESRPSLETINSGHESDDSFEFGSMLVKNTLATAPISKAPNRLSLLNDNDEYKKMFTTFNQSFDFTAEDESTMPKPTLPAPKHRYTRKNHRRGNRVARTISKTVTSMRKPFSKHSSNDMSRMGDHTKYQDAYETPPLSREGENENINNDGSHSMKRISLADDSCEYGKLFTTFDVSLELEKQPEKKLEEENKVKSFVRPKYQYTRRNIRVRPSASLIPEPACLASSDRGVDVTADTTNDKQFNEDYKAARLSLATNDKSSEYRKFFTTFDPSCELDRKHEDQKIHKENERNQKSDTTLLFMPKHKYKRKNNPVRSIIEKPCHRQQSKT